MAFSNDTPIIVFTDLDEEFDDKLALYFISKFGLNTTIVFMPSSQGSSQNGFDEWKRIFPSWNEIFEFTYITFERFVEEKSITCDYVLQISPMAKMKNGGFYSGHNLIVNKQYIFGGMYHRSDASTPSFNFKGSKGILDRFQSKLVEISSDLTATKRPFLELYNLLPPLFRENMRWTSFKLGLGRMSQKHPVAHIYAEGLINHLKGRGANLESVRTLYNSVYEYEIQNNIIPAFEKIILDKNRYKKTYEITKKYLDSIKADHPMSEPNLFRMNIALSIIFPRIWDDQDVLIQQYDISLEDPKIQKLWERFKTFPIQKLIKTFNPVYDLFAAYILFHIIKTNFSNMKFSIEQDIGNQFESLIVEYLKKSVHGTKLV